MFTSLTSSQNRNIVAGKCVTGCEFIVMPTPSYHHSQITSQTLLAPPHLSAVFLQLLGEPELDDSSGGAQCCGDDKGHALQNKGKDKSESSHVESLYPDGTRVGHTVLMGTKIQVTSHEHEQHLLFSCTPDLKSQLSDILKHTHTNCAVKVILS